MTPGEQLARDLWRYERYDLVTLELERYDHNSDDPRAVRLRRLVLVSNVYDERACA